MWRWMIDHQMYERINHEVNGVGTGKVWLCSLNDRTQWKGGNVFTLMRK